MILQSLGLQKNTATI